MEAATAPRGAAPATQEGLKRAISRNMLLLFAVMCSGLGSASTLARAFGGDYLAEFVSVPTVLVAFVTPHICDTVSDAARPGGMSMLWP